jgi:hypothetical protein
MSSVRMLARHAFFPFREPLDAFPIAAGRSPSRARGEGKPPVGEVWGGGGGGGGRREVTR